METKRKRGRPRKGVLVLKPLPKSQVKKNNFISGYEFWGGTKYKAAQYAHVSNKSYYNWIKSDPEFVRRIKEIDAEILKVHQEELLYDLKFQKHMDMIERVEEIARILGIERPSYNP